MLKVQTNLPKVIRNITYRTNFGWQVNLPRTNYIIAYLREPSGLSKLEKKYLVIIS